MILLLKTVLRKLGIDKAIFYTITARLTQGVGGVISLFFVATFLTGIEQGFYFTFVSILAIQVFFELGLTEIIIQFVAHESSHLNVLSNKVQGNDKHLSRLASLLHFCVKWYAIIALLLFFTLTIVGFFYFTYFYKDDVVVNWQFPWLILCFTTSFYLVISPILAFLEGLGEVKNIAKFRLVQQILTMLVLWVCLSQGGKLYVGGFSAFAGASILVILVYNKYSLLLKEIWKVHTSHVVDYKKEIFPYQWKIAISWISGYFIFQLFNPVLFAVSGPIVAGQMGMTLVALNSIMNLTFSWYTTKVPQFSSFIAQKKYTNLDVLFVSVQKQSTAICVLLLSVMFLFLYVIEKCDISIVDTNLRNKFLPFYPLLFMTITVILRQIYGGWATYIRCHKTEPFLIQSVVTAIASIFSTLFLGKFYGVFGITLGYLLLNVIAIYWIYRIYKKNKLLLHAI